LLGRGLSGVKADPLDLDARLEAQLGAWMSMIGSQTGVPKGASHGIGHVLGGTAHVPHGYTSCVMLPHVLRFNLPVNADRQALVSEALGRQGEAAADVVAALIAGLGLPGRLRDVGVEPEQLDRIAASRAGESQPALLPRSGPSTLPMAIPTSAPAPALTACTRAHAPAGSEHERCLNRSVVGAIGRSIR
jgi:alcohol dehydrogenase class IV